MRVNFTDRGPCHMKPGDIRRIPRDRTKRLISYQLGCPDCGFVITVFPEEDFAICESTNGISFGKIKKCPFCHSDILLKDNCLKMSGRKPN